jgi:hypothetical protein
VEDAVLLGFLVATVDGRPSGDVVGSLYAPTMADAKHTTHVSSLPALDPILGTLPPSPLPYRVTMSDVHSLFVASAPFKERRERLFRAFALYAETIWTEIPGALLWIDGGFITHKSWEEPHDVDVAIIADDVPAESKRRLATQGLLTFDDTSGTINSKQLQIGKLAPFGGMIDSYLASSKTASVYRIQWSRVRGPDGQIIPNASKGFLEVARGII